MDALKKKERQDETQFTTKTEGPPPLNANVFYTLFMIMITMGSNDNK